MRDRARRRPRRRSGSNAAHITARFDERTGTVVAICAIDNLTKGASGGAIQAANVALGLPRPPGLTVGRALPVSAATARPPRRRPPSSSRPCPTSAASPASVVVVKYGGNALAGTSEADALALFAQDIVLMRPVGMRPVVVHGGGPQISDLMARLGKETEFRNGLRVTDAETVDIARMVLRRPGQPAARRGHQRPRSAAPSASSGEDAGLIRRRRRATPTSGSSATSSPINPTILQRLLDEDLIPVVATIGSDAAGQAYNINADTVAGAIAEALGPEKLVYLTDIEGPAARRRRPRQPDPPDDAPTSWRRSMADGTIAGGMIPKVESCVARRARRGAAAPTSSTGGSPTCCCSSSSPTPASAPWSPLGLRQPDRSQPEVHA